MLDARHPDDGRGRVPVVVKARTSVALREAIKRAAAAEHLTTGEFIRRALSDRIEALNLVAQRRVRTGAD